MTTTERALLDYCGLVLFHCDRCGEALTQDDLFDLGLRLPDPDETRDEYRATELIDDLTHPACLRPLLSA